MILTNAVMKGIIILAGLMMIAGLAIAQPNTPKSSKPDSKKEIKEVPSASNHGKAISELAKETPGGPEKGKIISSAARQRGIENKEIKAVGSGQNNSSRPDFAGKPEIKGQKPASSGKSMNQPPSRPKPGNIIGG
jgi:hypothetical protein